MGNEEVAAYLSDTEIGDAENFRRAKKTAMLVIMFIDMVHSTELREQMGEVQFEFLRRQKKDDLIMIIEQEDHGKVIKDTGDGLLCVFAIPDVAVRKALEIQEHLREHASLSVRIGLDMGQVTQETEQGIVKDVFGRHVNRAARLETLGDGGHILVSYSVWDSAKGWLKHIQHINWRKHGSYRLKGLAEPQVVYEPYDKRVSAPLDGLRGERVRPEDELTYCSLCGRYVKLKETFTCRRCGRAEVCIQYCYDASQRQCIECASQVETTPVASSLQSSTEQSSAPTSESKSYIFDVLLSYAPQDSSFIQHFSDYLENEGLSIWLEEEQIDIGDPVTQKIEQGLRESRFIIICLSRYFSDSRWCYPECAPLLIREMKADTSRVLPIIVGDYDDSAIPDFLYDKYCVDIRAKEGLERLMRKIAPAAAGAAFMPQEEEPADLETLHDGLQDVQSILLEFSRVSHFNDEMIVKFDKLGIQLISLLEAFPHHFDAFREVFSEYQYTAEQLFSQVNEAEYLRVLHFRFKKVEQCIEDLAGGFNCGESFLDQASDGLLPDSPYSFYNFEDLELKQVLKKLVSGKDIEESEALEWLFRSGFATLKSYVERVTDASLLNAIFSVFWKRSPRLLLYYRASFWDVLKYMLQRDKIRWKLRFHALKLLLKRSLSAQQAAEILQTFVPGEQRIFSAFLMLHPRQECRQLALKNLPGDNRWDLLLCPYVPLLIIKELVTQSCQDSSDSYLKAVFLLLRPRLLAIDSPLAIREAYNILKLFYHHAVFLQETFFQALTELHKQLSRKALAHPLTQHLEPEFNRAFQAFCSKGMLKDANITEMTHIPLPVQRKLAHDGYLPKYFICNVRDVIALETIPHVERRPDVMKFFRLRRINGRALEKLATNDLVMREYQNRSAFCHHPKAGAAMLRKYLSTLSRRDLQDISRNRNVSQYARNLAIKYLSRVQR